MKSTALHQMDEESEILDLGELTCWASTLGGHSSSKLSELENKFSLSMKEIGTV